MKRQQSSRFYDWSSINRGIMHVFRSSCDKCEDGGRCRKYVRRLRWNPKAFRHGSSWSSFFMIVGSIAWQLVASAFPLAFMANPLTYILLRIALMIEIAGICNGELLTFMQELQVSSVMKYTSELQKNVQQRKWQMIELNYKQDQDI